jgi:hypothetical protein
MTLESKTISILLRARAEAFEQWRAASERAARCAPRPAFLPRAEQYAEAWGKLGRVIKYVREQATIERVKQITGGVS